MPKNGYSKQIEIYDINGKIVFLFLFMFILVSRLSKNYRSSP